MDWDQGYGSQTPGYPDAAGNGEELRMPRPPDREHLNITAYGIVNVCYSREALGNTDLEVTVSAVLLTGGRLTWPSTCSQGVYKVGVPGCSQRTALIRQLGSFQPSPGESMPEVAQRQ